jgi:septum formation protein
MQRERNNPDEFGSRVGFHAAEIVLASSSPTRQDLLRRAGYEFRVMPPRDCESVLDPLRLSPQDYVQAQAYLKARDVAERVDFGIVVGADTVAALGGRVFGKPRDPADRRRMLAALAGTTHEVLTGLTVIDVGTDRRLIACERTPVRMRPLTAAEIDALVMDRSGPGATAAGGYAVGEGGDERIEILRGSKSNVIGLPLELLGRMLEAVRRGAVHGRTLS